MTERGITESVVEDAALSWFESLGYAILHGPDIAPGEFLAEREDHGQVVLEARLRSALEKLNPSIPADALDEAFRKVTRTESPSLTENNRRFHDFVFSAGTYSQSRHFSRQAVAITERHEGAVCRP